MQLIGVLVYYNMGIICLLRVDGGIDFELIYTCVNTDQVRVTTNVYCRG